MAYISTEEVREIRNMLKDEFKGYKFSVSRSDSMSVNIAIMAGPVDFSDIAPDGYCQINQYHLGNYGEHQELLAQIYRISQTAPGRAPGGEPWYDRSDSTVDYFDTAYYIHIAVGKYDRPYEHRKKK